MLSMFRKLTGTPSDATGLEYCLWAGLFTSVFVATAMIDVTRFATLQAASHAVVARLL
jgi:Flp pilus assembly pilin Flp